MCGKEWRLEQRDVVMKGKVEVWFRGGRIVDRIEIWARKGKALKKMLCGLETWLPVAKSLSCSLREPEFGSLHLYGDYNHL